MNTLEKTCPYCAELIKAEAIKCKHCRSSLALDPSISGQPVKGSRADALVFVLLISLPFVIGALMLAWYSGLPAGDRARIERPSQN
jgi:hypothetical protein